MIFQSHNISNENNYGSINTNNNNNDNNNDINNDINDNNYELSIITTFNNDELNNDELNNNELNNDKFILCNTCNTCNTYNICNLRNIYNSRYTILMYSGLSLAFIFWLTSCISVIYYTYN